MNTTAALVKAALSIPVGVTYYDGRAGSAASAANAYVLGRLRQDSLAVLTETEYPEVYTSGTTDIVLRRRPVVGIAAVTCDGTAVSASAYRVDTRYGILRRTDGGYWSTALDGVQVHYGAGYDSSTVPADLTEAATQIAASMFHRGGMAGLSEQDDGAVDVRVSEDAVPPTARAILARYRDITP